MEEFYCGKKAEEQRIITEEDILAFAEVSRDYNPIHVDKQIAEKSIFGQQIAHGMLSASMFSGILGTKMPGSGTIYLKQELEFLKPVFVGDCLTAKVEIVEILPKNKAKLSTIITNQKSENVVSGHAIVKLPHEQRGDV